MQCRKQPHLDLCRSGRLSSVSVPCFFGAPRGTKPETKRRRAKMISCYLGLEDRWAAGLVNASAPIDADCAYWVFPSVLNPAPPSSGMCPVSQGSRVQSHFDPTSPRLDARKAEPAATGPCQDIGQSAEGTDIAEVGTSSSISSVS